jgi:hypothetical protein
MRMKQLPRVQGATFAARAISNAALSAGASFNDDMTADVAVRSVKEMWT